MDGNSAASEASGLGRRLADGDPEAFAELYDQFGGRLYRTAARYLGSSAEAEDAVQELFVAVVRSRQQLRKVDNLAAYLFVALRRLIGKSLDERRARSKVAEQAATNVGRDSDLPLVDLRDWLSHALRQLPAEQLDVVVLKFESQLTFGEIGQVLEISPNTAASRYRYAMDRLRSILEQEEVRRGRGT